MPFRKDKAWDLEKLTYANYVGIMEAAGMAHGGQKSFPG